MLNYIISALVIMLVIYWVSYSIKRAMIKKALRYFAISHIGRGTVGVPKLKAMNIQELKSLKSLERMKVSDLAFKMLSKSEREIGKIINVFNWKKSFIYGNDFIYKKYIGILGTIKINKIQDKIIELERIMHITEMNDVLRGYGVQDSDRNKVLADIANSNHRKASLHKNVAFDRMREKPVEFFKINPVSQEKVTKMKEQTIAETERLVNDYDVNNEDRDINDILKERNIKIED